MPALLVTAILGLTAALPALADGGDRGNRGNPGIAPINSRPYGQSYSQWAAAWWQWAYSIPSDINPIHDSTGENADIGQGGPVWFLAGAYVPDPIVREVVVPEGKSLFFPIMNQSWVQFPDDPPYTIPELRAILRPGMEGAVLTCEIDGRFVRNPNNYLEESVVFITTVPDGNDLGLPAGDYAPSLDNGYYLMLEPLARGRHTIHFTAHNADDTFSLDVTYHITVAKNGHGRGGDDDCDGGRGGDGDGRH